jgi:hypothetical protein
MTTPAIQSRPAARTTRWPDADPNHSGNFSRAPSDVAICSVVPLIVVFQVADHVLGRNKASCRLKII